MSEKGHICGNYSYLLLFISLYVVTWHQLTVIDVHVDGEQLRVEFVGEMGEVIGIDLENLGDSDVGGGLNHIQEYLRV